MEKERAKRLSDMLADTGISALFASQFKRTQQTLEPLAERTGLNIETVSAYLSGELIERIAQRYRGKIIAVASHSDRVTEIIEGLGGDPVGIIPESEYDNLFIVTVLESGTAKVVRIKF
jgi:broad specificity phosphatase PhoE